MPNQDTSSFADVANFSWKGHEAIRVWKPWHRREHEHVWATWIYFMKDTEWKAWGHTNNFLDYALFTDSSKISASSCDYGVFKYLVL